MSRVISAAFVAAIAMLYSSGASAIEYPWCAEYSVRGGATNCGFATYEQCRATVSGVGGFCRQNYFYRGGPAYGAYRAPAPRHSRNRRVRRGHY